jgi:hypothetical protein
MQAVSLLYCPSLTIKLKTWTPTTSGTNTVLEPVFHKRVVLLAQVLLG